MIIVALKWTDNLDITVEWVYVNYARCVCELIV